MVGGQPLAPQGLRLLNRTRLKLGVNYANPSAPESNAPEGSLEEFLPPFALLKVEEEPAANSNPNPDRWQYCNKMEQSRFHGGTRPGPAIKTSYHLSMQENVPGIVLKAAGSLPHAVALNYFDDVTYPTRVKPEVSYLYLRATVCAESDNYAEGVYAVDPLPPDVPIQELVVDMGDDYRLDFLAENTIVDLKAGVPVLADSAAVLRDDRKYLKDIARIAFEWYREDRNALTVEFRQLRNLFGLGQLITTIGSGSTQSNINTVISCLTYNFDKAGTTTVETSDQTLDVRGLG